MGITGGNPGFIGGAEASVAAGDITDVGATGEALVQAATAADGREALELEPRREDGTSQVPLLWYKCDSTDPTATTLANSGSLGTQALALTNAVPGAEGPLGDRALRIAANGYGIAPVDVARPTSAISVCLWFRQNASADARIVSRAYNPLSWGGAPYAAVWIFVAFNGTVYCGVTLSGTERQASSPAGFATPGEWHHVCLTYDGTTIKAYVDGILAGSASYSGTIDYGGSATSTRWSFGGNNVYTPDALLGKICDPRVYDSALSAAKVAEIYSRGRGLGAP